ncbi:MAG: translocation/assembly module TamB domain-containing protein [Oligoflexales bacterium]
MNRGLWKKFFIGSALIIGLHTFFHFILNSQPTEQVIRGIVAKEIEPQIGLGVQFKNIHFRFFPFKFEVAHLSLFSEKEKIVTIEKSSVSIVWWALAMGSPHFLDITIDGVSYHQKPLLQDNETPSSKNAIKEEPFKPILLPIHKIYLDHLELSFETPHDKENRKEGEWYVFLTKKLSGELAFSSEGLKYILRSEHFHMQTEEASMVEGASVSAEGLIHYDGTGKGQWELKAPRLDVQGKLEHTTGGKDQGFLIANDIRGVGNLSILGSWLDIGTTRGQAQIDARVEVLTATDQEASQLTIDGRFHVSDAYLDRFYLHDVSGGLSFYDNELKLRQLKVSVDGKNTLDINGVIETKGLGEFRFHASPQGIRLSTLMDALQVDFHVFDANLHQLDDKDVLIHGKMEPFELYASSHLKMKEIDFKEIKKFGLGLAPECDVNLDFHADSSSFQFGETTAQCQTFGAKGHDPDPDSSTYLTLNGLVEYNKKMDVKVQMQDLGPGLFAAYLPAPLSGAGEIDFHVHGNVEHPVRVDGSLKFQDSIISGIDLGSWSSEFSFEEDLLSWRNLKGRWSSGHYDSSVGSLRIKDLWLSGKLNVFHLPEPTYRGLAHWVELPVMASIVSAKLDVKGPLLFPLAMTGKIEASGREVFTEENYFCDDFHFEFQGTKKGWASKSLRFELGTLGVFSQVSLERPAHTLQPFLGPHHSLWERLGLSLASKVKIEAESKKVSGRGRGPTLERLPFLGDFAKKAKLVGQPSFEVNLEGNLLSLQGTMKAKVSELAVNGALSANWQMTGFVEGGHLDLTVQHAGRALNGRMAVELFEPGLPYKWYVRLDRFDMRSGFPEAFHQDPRNFAYLTADWEMKGNLKSWWASEGLLSVEGVQLHYARDLGSENRVLEATNLHPMRIVFSEQGWRTQNHQPLVIAGSGGQVSIQLTNHRPPDHFGIELVSRVELAPVADMSRYVESGSGVIHAKTTLTGPFENLQVRSVIWTEKTDPEVSLSLPFLRPMFRGVMFKAVLDQNILQVQSFKARKGSGFVTASGRVNLGEEGPSSDLDLSFQHAQAIFTVPVLKSFEGTFSGDLHLSGKRPFDVTGQIQVERGRTAHQFDLRDEIAQSVGQQRLRGHEVDADPLFRFDVAVKADKSIYVQNRNLQMILSAELTIQGMNSQPVLNGHVYVNKGKLIYKREFEFIRGDLVFDDTVSSLPTLDVIAVADVAPYQVTIAATGNVADLDVQLTADPPTREDGSVLAPLDIIVLLSKGSLPSGTRSVVGSTASSEALNLVLSQLEQPLETLAELTGQNFFHLYIDTLPDKAGLPVPRLNGTFNLSKNLDVVIRGGQKGWTVSAEMPLHESVSTSMNYSTTEDDVGGDVENAQTGQSVEANLRFRFSFE